MSETEVSNEAQVVDTDDLDTFSADFFGQEPVKSPDETKPEGVEQDTDPVEPTEAEAQDVDPNEDPDAEYKEAPKKKKTVQDRIDEVVKQREDYKRESEAQMAQLRKEIEALKTPAQPQVEAAEPQPDELKADGTEKYPLGEFDPAYIRDLTKFTFEQERAQAVIKAQQERQQWEQDQARQALTSSWNEKLEVAKTEYPDLIEKGQQLLNNFGGLDPAYAGYLSTVLMSMEKGPDVLYYLSNHPEEATKIVNSGAQQATLALGRIESKYLEADALKQVAKPKISKAPAPPPVRARGTNGAFIAVAPDTDDLDAFASEFFKR